MNPFSFLSSSKDIVPFSSTTGNGETHILITGGMDGDEYVGIETAFQLIDWVKQQKFSSKITIVPIVNISGFKAGISQNPLDGKYPKHIFPGNSNGTSSERLIANMWKQHQPVSVWIDLHGGARNEKLYPHVLGFLTENNVFNNAIKGYLRALNYPLTVLTKWNKVNTIAKNDCIYLMFESGDKGLLDLSSVDLLKQWVETILHGAEEKEREVQGLRYYSREFIDTAPHDGFFVPVSIGNDVNLGETIGNLYSINKKDYTSIKSSENGKVLYQRIYGWVNKGEDLLAGALDLIEE